MTLAPVPVDRVDFAPFRLSTRTPLTAPWLRWLGGALRAGGRPLEPLPAPPSDDLTAVVPALRAHGVAPLLYVRLRDDPMWEALPPAPRAVLVAAFQESATRAFTLEVALGEAAAALAAADVPVMLLKGAALGRLIYGSPAERPMGDLDLLVPAARVDAGMRALAALGYRPAGLSATGRLGRWQRRYRCEAPFVAPAGPRGGLLVELHWSLVELPYYIDRIDLDEMWRRKTPAAGLPGAALPDAADLLIHACAHLALHHSGDARLIWLTDIDRLARSAGLSWAAVVDRAGRWGLGLAVHAALGAAAAWLGTPRPADASAALARLADDPAGRAMWGLGDEQPGRTGRRARASWRAFTPRQRVRYAAWLALRAITQPFEAGRGGKGAGRPPASKR